MTGLKDTLASLAAGRLALDPASGASTRLVETLKFGDNPGALRMLVHTPATVSAQAALVVVLHGCTQTAEAYAHGAGWLELADRYGFVVLCPEQTRANNLNRCFNWFQAGDVARGAGEVASIHAMIAQALRDGDLDARRVFVTGLSAGGAMANAMLAAYPETFAGGAIVAGLPYGAASNMGEAFGAMRNGVSRSAKAWGDLVREASGHAGAWPTVSIWQGDADGTVHPGVADELVRQWTDVHGVGDAAGEIVVQDGRRRHTAWRKPSRAPVVELHRIAGMGHGAALGSAVTDGFGTAGPYLLEVGVASSLEIARAWGLTDDVVAGVASPKSPPAVAKPRPAGPASALRGTGASKEPPPRPAAGLDVGAVITGALRAARLLK